jgi:hypothetical protein
MRLIKPWQRSRRLVRDDGTVAIEFAIVGFLFFALLLGAIEMGRAMWMRNTFQFAAEEAARWALVHTSEKEKAIQDYASARLLGAFKDIKPVAIFKIEKTVSGIEVKYLVVTITDIFKPVTGLVPISFTVTGQAKMPVG